MVSICFVVFSQLRRLRCWSFIVVLTILFICPQIWYNPLLAWNSSEYGGLTAINVAPKNVWLPDIVLYEK